MDNTTLRKFESISLGKGPLFDWQQEPQLVPYYLQGNRRFESNAMIEARNRIRNSPEVRESINRFWSLVKKNPMGRVEKEVYTQLCLCFSKLLLPDFSRDDSLKVIEEDWDTDSAGADALDYKHFYDAIFQLADIWTEEVNPNTYAEFLIKIYRRITTKRVVTQNGEVKKIMPSIKLVFPDSVKKEDDWEDVHSDESYDSDYEYNFQEAEGKRQRVKRLKRETNNEKEGDELMYDEIVGSDWEIPEEDEQIEMSELDDIIPFGKIAHNYISSLHDPRAQEEHLQVPFSTFSKAVEIQEKLEHEEDEEEEEMAPLKMVSLSSNDKNFLEVKSWNKKIQEAVKETNNGEMTPVGLFLHSLSKSVQDYITIIPDEKKTYIRNTLKRKSSIKITNASVKIVDGNLSATKIGNRPSVHDFNLTAIPEHKGMEMAGSAILGDDMNSGELSLQSGIPTVKSATISGLRKSLLEQKYLPMMKRFERKTIVLSKKGKLPTEEVSSLSAVNQSKIEDVEEEINPEPLKLLESLQSAEKAPTVDPNNGLWDIIERVNNDVLKILILGKPRSGKTTLAKDLAASLDLKHIEITSIIEALIKKGQVEDEEMYDEDNPKPEVYTPFEKEILQRLSEGKSLTDEQIIALADEAIHSDEAESKGFVLDLPLTPELSGFILSVKFNFVVDLDISNNDLVKQVDGLKWDPTTNTLYTKYNITELKKPKMIVDENDEPIEDETPKPKFEEFVVRADDTNENYYKSIGDYVKKVRSMFDGMINSLPVSWRFDFDAAGLNPTVRRDAVLAKLGSRKNKLPAAKILEPENDFKALLFQNIDEGKEPRSWSIWKQIDPVALKEEKVVEGKPEFAVEFSNNVFVMSSEENQKKFASNPRKYLNDEPKMPQSYRVLLIGPPKSGKRTQAEYLSAKYGWKLFEANEVVSQSIMSQKKNRKLLRPSHPESGFVQASEPEFQSILKGGALASPLLMPILLQKLGVPLQKKPPPPPTPKEGEEEEPPTQQPTDRSMRSKKDDKDSDKESSEGAVEEQKIIEDAPLGEEPAAPEVSATPEPIVYEDLPLTEIVAQPIKPEDLRKIINGLIMIGYPATVEDAQLLKDSNFEFDKILYFIDPTDGQELVKRGIEEMFDLTQELTLADQVSGACKEVFGEETVIEIPIVGSEEEVHNLICRKLDPFYVQIDAPEINIVKDDVEEGKVPLPLGEYGKYDPVVMKEDKWIIPGSEEFEVQSFGKRYIFAGEAEMEKFNKNPLSYISQEPVVVPQPHLMVFGSRGSGVNTMVSLVSQNYQVESVPLKNLYLKVIAEEQLKRRKERLLRKGFTPKEETDEPYDPLNDDPEITEEAEDFNQALHEQKMMRDLLKGDKPLIINSRWFDIEEEKVSQNLIDILSESRRLPEIAFILKSSEENTIKRLLGTEGIEAEYNRIMEQRRIEKQKAKEEAREEARRQRIENGEDEEELPQEEEEEEDEEDPDAPVLADMLEEAKQKIIQMRENDIQQMEETKEKLEEKGVIVFEINGDMSVERMYQKIDFEIKQQLKGRENLIERQTSVKLSKEKAMELLQTQKVLPSAVRFNSPIKSDNLRISTEFPVLYRDRIYFPNSIEEQKSFIETPLAFSKIEAAPWDIHNRPYCAIIGNPLTGKTALAKDLAKELGIVRISLRETIEEVLKLENELGQRVRDVLGNGYALEESLAVEIICWRIEQHDVVEHGCVLDGFPKTIQQAMLLAEFNKLPNPIFYLDAEPTSVLKRRGQKFKHDKKSLNSQIKQSTKNNNEILSWVQNTFDTARYLSTDHSKWWVKDTAIEHLSIVYGARNNYAIAKLKGTPINIQYLGIARQDISSALSKFKRYDIVIWKFRGELKEVKNSDYVVEYNSRFYVFSSKENMDAFIATPEKFLNAKPLPKDLPRQLQPSECGEIAESRIELDGHCVVTLEEDKSCVRGDPMILAAYKDRIFSFANNAQRNKFMRKPQKYEKTNLPVKIPPKPGNVPLSMLGEFENSIGYIEQSLGQVVIKALLEVGSQKLVYPLLSVKESALKHFGLYLKAHNPKNSRYQNKKYAERMKEFREHCTIMQELYEEGVRKENGELKDWEIKNNYTKGDNFSKMLDQYQKDKNSYLAHFIR
ncbi:unnamed protein product [Blepharisma stoltei]|uniref:Adenylate kinase n=1 Tax=Blepharisma stoltei TaxID=1481888 RepID=A0AAU9JSV6_9CILI|nr:unnamed protein product [Blepharisma stoltei]